MLPFYNNTLPLQTALPEQLCMSSHKTAEWLAEDEQVPDFTFSLIYDNQRVRFGMENIFASILNLHIFLFDIFFNGHHHNTSAFGNQPRENLIKY